MQIRGKRCFTYTLNFFSKRGELKSKFKRLWFMRREVLMLMKNFYIIFGILFTASLSLFLLGCTNSFTDQPERTPSISGPADESPTSEVSPMPETPDRNERRPEPTLPGGLERIPTQESEPVVGEVPGELMEEIIADLAGRIGAEREAIEVVRAEAVVWNDGSLGCPKPGEFYIQMLINGYWVVLEVDGIEYDYRANDSDYFTLCEGKGVPPMPPPGSGVDIENPLITQAKEDLAERLGIPPNQIALTSYEEVVWPDSSLGCPQPGMEYLQVPKDGALIRLHAEGQDYDYHSGGNRGVFLCEKLSKNTKNPPPIDIVPPPGSADE